MCAILTGKPPFGGTDAGTTLRLAAAGDVRAALARLATANADPGLIAIARRCLSRDPADRPPDGGCVAAEIAAYRSGVEDRLHQAEHEWAVAAARAEEEASTRPIAPPPRVAKR